MFDDVAGTIFDGASTDGKNLSGGIALNFTGLLAIKGGGQAGINMQFTNEVGLSVYTYSPTKNKDEQKGLAIGVSL